jgi:hypothetical protein
VTIFRDKVMKTKIEEILDELIAEVKKGRTVDDCLREYPEYADELRPLLHLVNSIAELPKPEPSPEAIETVIDQARVLSNEQKAPKGFSLREIFALRPVMVRVAAIALLVFVVGLTTVSLSANSLPGHMLYPVKIATERVQLFLTTDTKGKARLHVVYADKRTDEFVSLLTPGVKINEDLLAEMLHETELAINCAELLDENSALEIIDQIDECSKQQMEVLEEARRCACEVDIAVIEEAIKECLDQHKCIECMKSSDASNGHCP